ncbi:MAG: hypothetical protein QG629_789, partial [Patescibacteria group bacterium]|nr:hypothetical protein [Patescibacteria group bacterium]
MKLGLLAKFDAVFFCQGFVLLLVLEGA